MADKRKRLTDEELDMVTGGADTSFAITPQTASSVIGKEISFTIGGATYQSGRTDITGVVKAVSFNQNNQAVITVEYLNFNTQTEMLEKATAEYSDFRNVYVY